jgi:hypothetical protein
MDQAEEEVTESGHSWKKIINPKYPKSNKIFTKLGNLTIYFKQLPAFLTIITENATKELPT